MEKTALATRISGVAANVERVIFGKHHEIELALVALICRGHILVEDVPGTGKTVLAKALARSLGCSFRRIQFTPTFSHRAWRGARSSIRARTRSSSGQARAW